MPTFEPIAQTIAEIWPFFNFVFVFSRLTLNYDLDFQSPRAVVMTSARITGGGRGIPPTAIVDAHVIHDIEISALSAPRVVARCFF